MKHKSLLWQIPFLLFLVLASVYIIRENKNQPYLHEAGYIFGTEYHLTYQASKSLQAEVEKELQAVDNSLSTFNKQSTISLINQGQQPDLAADERFLEVYQLARKVSEDTDGAFDITVAPLVNAWGFGFKKEQLPGKQTVDSLRQLVGYQNVNLNHEGRHIYINKVNPRMMLDCSAIAKGYGVDRAAKVLKVHGVENFMVEIGGEVITRGKNDKGKDWTIGITEPTDDPSQSNLELDNVVSISGMALATSGNYRNFYYKGGRRYAHTIDPKTGYPVQHNILSATVIAPDCATADAYATSFMVMGLIPAKAVLERNPKLMAYFICANPKGGYTTWYSPALKDKLAK